jgi:hypothetical protein
VHVLDNQQKRLTAGGSIDEPRKRNLLAARAGAGVDCLVEVAVFGALWRLNEIAQIERVVHRRCFGCKRLVDVVGRGVARQIEEAANERAKRTSSSLDTEVQRPADVPGEAELGGDRLQFLHETRLADARLAAQDDDCGRLPDGDTRERTPALGKLRAAADKWPALRWGLSQPLEAKNRNGIVKAFKILFPESFVVDEARGRVQDLLRRQDLTSSGTVEKPSGEIGRLADQSCECRKRESLAEH